MGREYYKFLSNSLTSALVREGSVEWFTVPRFDSSSIFTRLLDEERGGHFTIAPINGFKAIKESYIEDTLILRTVFETDEGKAELIDFLPVSLSGMIRIYQSEVDLEMTVDPYFEYGLVKPSVLKTKRGLTFRNPKSKEGVEVVIGGDFAFLDTIHVLIRKGRGYVFLLYSKDLRYGLQSSKAFVYPDPFEALELTIKYWRRKVSRAIRVSEFDEAFRRSVLVLLGLIYEPSGGIIAAPTTSLPEVPGGSRNWDYRYVWVRDAAYSAEALVKANLLNKARDVLNFLTSMIDLSSKSFDHPLYTVDGTAPPAEELAEWLRGHKKSYPVRIGNAAYIQVQMDVEGAYMHALFEYFRASKDANYVNDIWWAVEAVAGWTKKSWGWKSTDIWEQRGVEEHFVHTKVMNWVALDRASRLAEALGFKGLADDWRAVAEEIRHDVLKNGYSEKLGYFVQYYGSSNVDAALLTLPLYGFIDARDVRFLNTLRKIEEDLSVSEGLLLRYKNDFLGEAAYPFTLVSTWLARVYLRLNDLDKARRVIRRLVECSTDALLIAEHVDPATCEPRGNFPQAFPHAGLIITLTELEEVKKESALRS
ncbi:MAG: glycoside hydrolase family 15 protein [Sulfolobales archaeon]|nr:glycoside hydrolase family 15 protein [Sulfolobales archaeon]MDT7906238.1 glycoside hydrolase family 15 protein [Sulfolobales archaeon]